MVHLLSQLRPHEVILSCDINRLRHALSFLSQSSRTRNTHVTYALPVFLRTEVKAFMPLVSKLLYVSFTKEICFW